MNEIREAFGSALSILRCLPLGPADHDPERGFPRRPRPSLCCTRVWAHNTPYATCDSAPPTVSEAGVISPNFKCDYDHQQVTTEHVRSAYNRVEFCDIEGCVEELGFNFFTEKCNFFGFHHAARLRVIQGYQYELEILSVPSSHYSPWTEPPDPETPDRSLFFLITVEPSLVQRCLGVLARRLSTRLANFWPSAGPGENEKYISLAELHQAIADLQLPKELGDKLTSFIIGSENGCSFASVIYSLLRSC